MSQVHICYSLKSSRIGPEQKEIFEKDYENVYKPAAKFLYSHPEFRMSFAFNGVQIDFLQKEYPEFIEILRELISRKQIEILGGGYYDPVFPLLFPMDRTGQIEFLTSTLRSVTGKRPRGINLCASIWDYSLVSCFYNCGMDYVLLDDSLIPDEKQKFVPLIMSDKGKTISILPLYQEFKPEIQDDPRDYLNLISKKIAKSSKNAPKPLKECVKGLDIQFTHEEFQSLLRSGYLEKLYREISEKKDFFDFATPITLVKEAKLRIPVYIASGMSREVGQWGIEPYRAVKADRHYPVSIYDFFQIYPQSRALYDRMLYVSMLVNQSHGDKLRKTSAREKLWEAQNGDGFICTSKGAFVSATYRQQAYKKLTEAEKIARQCGEFKETFVSYDYTGEGLNEYICRMNKYFAVISLGGGAIRELDVLQNSGNFADNLNCVKEFEGYDDNYERGLFIDHIFSEDEFNAYIQNKPSGNGIFSKYIYSELDFSSQRKEVKLVAEAKFQNRQKISLKKKYVCYSSGMMIQYILKNESGELLKAKFAVESSFAQTNFNAKDFNAFSLDIVTNGKRQEINTKTSSYELNDSGKLSDVEGIWVTDTDNNITFVFEPNESCGMSFNPIVFKRPEYTTGELIPAGMTFANTMFWDIVLTPGMEMEKTINFSIFSQKKK